MLTGEEKARYSKQVILPELGMHGQEQLKAAKVLVIGAGGLGCPILQYLTAAGVGTIGIADGDNVDITNLQRQVLYTTEDIGSSKAATAHRKMAALNPNIHFNIHPFFIDNTNALEIIKGYDIIVDGSDNFATRYLVNDACVMLGKPMVSGAIYKFEGQVSVFNYKGGPTYRCLFPEPPGVGESPNCADIGVIATLPGIIGTIQANEVIKIIAGIGEVLSGKLLVIDTMTMTSHTFNFKLNEANKNITHLPSAEDEQLCEVQVRQLSYEELERMMGGDVSVQLIDVREIEEHAISNIGGINIPLSEFETGSKVINLEMPVTLYCASGVRSAHAARILLGKGFKQVYNLKGGVNALTL